MLQFKETHSRDPKTPFLAHGVQWYGWLGRHPRTHMLFSGIVQFKETHSRDAKTPFVALGVQWFGCLGRHPRTHTTFSDIVQFKGTHSRDAKTPLLVQRVQCYAVQKHLVLPKVCTGMGGWGATPEPT